MSNTISTNEDITFQIRHITKNFQMTCIHIFSDCTVGSGDFHDSGDNNFWRI